MDPVGLQPDRSRPSSRPTTPSGQCRNRRTIDGMACGRRIICQPAIIPASNHARQRCRAPPAFHQATGMRMAKRKMPNATRPSPMRCTDRRPCASMPSSFRHGSGSAVQDQANDGFPPRLSKGLLRMPPVSDHHAQPARYRPAKPISEALTDHERCHPFCPLPNRFPAYWRGTHGAFQLAVRPPSRRQISSSHRGYGPRSVRPSTPSRPFMTA